MIHKSIKQEFRGYEHSGTLKRKYENYMGIGFISCGVNPFIKLYNWVKFILKRNPENIPGDTLEVLIGKVDEINY